ncbi:MAG TPA: hypothetical protein VLL98_01130 [Rickettsiales bacterium]|nr:hypothetical protein [Rickettsiales bacterium]
MEEKKNIEEKEPQTQVSEKKENDTKFEVNEEIKEPEEPKKTAEDIKYVKHNNYDEDAKNNLSCVLNNFYIDENDVADLERVNDDFAPEIEAEKIKIEEEEKKKTGEVEEKEEKKMELEPLKSDSKLEDIAELDVSNIEEFLKKNGKLFPQADKNVETNNEDDIYSKELNNFKLDENLWSDLKLTNETKEKILNKIKIEMKTFLKNNLIPILKKGK